MSFRPLGSPTRRRQHTSYGDTSDIFVIIRDNKKRNAASEKTAELRGDRFGWTPRGKDNEQEAPTFDNPDHVLSISRRISSERKKKICITVLKIYESQLHTCSLVVGDHEFIMFCTVF